ncbi:hypothetical protein [Devosia sp. 66-22]|uniref:hypothetical protein n=1 Tax=Devosia sp. 66-22 TaxID=1895753 RepID=UPI000AD19CF0|nr:hypothetical protein [Devosia sp. 66-22]
MSIRSLLLASAAILALSAPAFTQEDPHHPDASSEPANAESSAPATPDTPAPALPADCPPQDMMMGPGMEGMPMMQMIRMMESMQLTQKSMMETMQLMREEMQRLKEEAAP